jgi:23S rRNA (cytosine1962-C5)-methyltransferase
MYSSVVLKKNQERRLLAGYPWVFSNEIASKDKGISSGDIVNVRTKDRKYVGTGFYNSNSLISVRLLTRSREIIDYTFFKKKFEAAIEYRRKICPGLESHRLVFGESDGLPGIIADKYGSCLSVKITAKGAQMHLKDIIRAAEVTTCADNIFVSTDRDTASLEKIDFASSWVKGSNPHHIKIEENGISFLVDIENGQKTGFFFDQRDNRDEVGRFSQNADVLDLFCYTGAFSAYAAKYGANTVTGVDSSGPAIENAALNMKLNGLRSCSFIKSDVFSLLESLKKSSRVYDLVIADPPALVKSKKDFFAGYKKYVRLNRLAIQVIRRSGVLFTSTCSYHMDTSDLLKAVSEAAAKVKRSIKVINMGFQAKDHPLLPSMPETLYLKGVFCRLD